MSALVPPFVDIDLRSYGQRWGADRHAFAQLVLPVAGVVEVEVLGRQARLDPLHGAVVVAGAWHAQRSDTDNRSVILDFDQAELEEPGRQLLLERPFAAIGPAARKLIEFMYLMAGQQAVQPAMLRGWTPLLLDTLALGVPSARSRLSALLAQVAANPGAAWTMESMAATARLSTSRLHALFREELESSPHLWLLRQRLDLACTLLAEGSRPIAEVALACGFSEQSALTRAMRTHLDTTPAAYRRSRQELASTKQ
ncbi:AraC family transcriptional regulator [Duganella phyllosphaerae]|uniref:RCS-specific HTH-type transcriptional activator RclR n=1 Tax=Duganella phyllosphaerae TaxID=762836 RepID=A0A1E7W8J3_9BURK|nr:AraC family transcriptional regulator [Duganella phyllosphaerae]OEZ92560.1 RCS-specific HTH-type transcriptional activator RclR [Duganella phyllosphaerae]